MLYAGTCLQHLDLSDNPLTCEVADSLAQMLRSQTHLRILNLNDTSLEDEGIATIAEALLHTGVVMPFLFSSACTCAAFLLCNYGLIKMCWPR